MSAAAGYLTLDELRQAIADGQVETVIMAITDMQGRLVGKRVSARLFLEDAAGHGVEACNYLLAVDVNMNTVDGYALSSWDSGYGDMHLIADLSTMRIAPWLTQTAIVLCDLKAADGRPVEPSPRRVLQRQLERLAERGFKAYVGTELEFLVFDESYRDAWRKGYRDLNAASDYNIDYALLASARMEPLMHDIRRSMEQAGMYCEGIKGECNFGQQEISFRYTDALTTCDNHSVYKNGAKEIADKHGKAITFMSKFNEREGNSCHIHISLRSTDGAAVFADEADVNGMSKLFKQFLAGQVAYQRELSLFAAPNINSYKRYVEGSFAPTALAWGFDNRTCALRVVGRGHGMRVEYRVPGGDVNQYLAVAALIAAGLRGIDEELELADAFVGNAYESDLDRVPSTLRHSADLFAESALARKAFGDEVVAHYLNNARIELAAFDAAITDWERVRGFERL